MKAFKKFLIITVMFFYIQAHSQENKKLFPFGTFHKSNITTHGISFGLASGLQEIKNNKTNGIRCELIGFGILIPLIPKSPIVSDESQLSQDSVSEKINGLNLSLSGSACNGIINGVSTGFIGEIIFQVNGLSAVGAFNFVQVSNGVQFAFIATQNFKINGLQIGAFNASVQTKGVQVGIINSSEHLRGFQFGLWNKNGKRSLPLLNWQFRA